MPYTLIGPMQSTFLLLRRILFTIVSRTRLHTSELHPIGLVGGVVSNSFVRVRLPCLVSALTLSLSSKRIFPLAPLLASISIHRAARRNAATCTVSIHIKCCKYTLWQLYLSLPCVLIWCVSRWCLEPQYSSFSCR